MLYSATFSQLLVLSELLEPQRYPLSLLAPAGQHSAGDADTPAPADGHGSDKAGLEFLQPDKVEAAKQVRGGAVGADEGQPQQAHAWPNSQPSLVPIKHLCIFSHTIHHRIIKSVHVPQQGWLLQCAAKWGTGPPSRIHQWL